jgi:hypothetical protein
MIPLPSEALCEDPVSVDARKGLVCCAEYTIAGTFVDSLRRFWAWEADALRDQRADLAVATKLGAGLANLEAAGYASVHVLAVVRSDLPLTVCGAPIPPALLREHARSTPTERKKFDGKFETPRGTTAVSRGT